jgi:hypothetical protein
MPKISQIYTRAVAYTASDTSDGTADIPSYILEKKPSDAIMCTSAGNLNVVFPNGGTAIVSAAVGIPVTVACKRIASTSTTAAGLTILYL